VSKQKLNSPLTQRKDLSSEFINVTLSKWLIV